VDDHRAQAVPEEAATLTSGVSSPGVNPPGRRKEDDTNLVTAWKLDNTSTDPGLWDDHVGTLRRGNGSSGAAGFAVGHIPEGQDCPEDPKPDGRRYAACGDAVTVPVAYWIGRRLMAIEASYEGAEHA
jgi:hypothetical protein